MDGTPRTSTRGMVTNRWLQLTAGITGMVMVANLQYGRTLFVNPIDAKASLGQDSPER